MHRLEGTRDGDSRWDPRWGLERLAGCVSKGRGKEGRVGLRSGVAWRSTGQGKASLILV